MLAVCILIFGEVERFDPNSTIPARVVAPLVARGHAVDVAVTAQPFALRDMYIRASPAARPRARAMFSDAERPRERGESSGDFRRGFRI